MQEATKIIDSRIASIKLKEKIESLQITKEGFLEKYGEKIRENEFECMLEGGYYYNDKMNEVASEFLNIYVNCKKTYDPIFSFRKGIGKGDLENFIEEITLKFKNLISRIKCATNKEYKFKSIKEFKNEFIIKSPLTIENFVNMNYHKDNFIVLKYGNCKGISGLASRIYIDDVGYNCIYINTCEPYGRQIFTFFHELYHIYFEKSDMQKVHVFKECKYTDVGNKIESKAHRFASNLMINEVELIKLLKENNMSNYKNIKYSDVYFLQKKFNATFQAIVYKIEQLEKDIINHIKNKKLPNEPLEIKSAIQNIPKISNDIKMYYSKSMWKNLNNKIKDEDPENIFNFPTYNLNKYI